MKRKTPVAEAAGVFIVRKVCAQPMAPGYRGFAEDVIPASGTGRFLDYLEMMILL
jgi:hypothetical protein